MKIGDITLKEIQQGSIPDTELPNIPGWDQIVGRPRDLEDLDAESYNNIGKIYDSVSGTFLTPGDLAYLDSITETYITNGAVTTPKIAAGAIDATKINVAQLSAISANIGAITAGSITGVTITGSLIRTATSGKRIEISQADNDIKIYDATQKVGTIYGSSTSLWLQSNVPYANISFANQGILLGTIGRSGSNYAMALNPAGSIFLAPNDGAFLFNYASKIGFQTRNSTTLMATAHLEPISDQDKRLGDSDRRWELWAYDAYVYGYLNVQDKFLRLAQISGSTASGLSAQNGSMYYRTDDHTIRVYLNGTWRTVSTT